MRINKSGNNILADIIDLTQTHDINTYDPGDGVFAGGILQVVSRYAKI